MNHRLARSFSLLLLLCVSGVFAQTVDYTFRPSPGRFLADTLSPYAYSTGVSLMRSNDDRFEREYPSVRPPVSTFRCAPQFVRINAAEDEVFVSRESGTRITIPANSLVDENGTPVSGEVLVAYTEFRNPGDFIRSGIPMSFAVEDDISYFRSAGMFEINASQNGNELFVAEGKEIQIDFVSTDPGEECDFWWLDDATGTWQNLGPAEKSSGVSSESGEDIESSKRLSRALRRFHNLVLKTDEYTDSTALDDRFADFNYVYNRHLSNGEKIPQEGLLRRDIRLSRIVRIANSSYTPDGEIVFDLITRYRQHPELGHYRPCRWVATEPVSLKEFRRKYGRKNAYSDVRILPNGDAFQLILKDDASLVTLDARPVRVNGNGELLTTDTRTDPYDRYSRTLKRRTNLSNKLAVRGRIEDNFFPIESEEMRYAICRNKIRRLMTDEEKKMVLATWITYYEERLGNVGVPVAESGQFNAELERALGISRFGIFNCDWMERLSNPTEMMAFYKTDEGTVVKPRSAYLVTGRTNGIIELNAGAPMGFNPSSFRMEMKRLTCLIVIDDREQMYWINQPTLNRMKFRSSDPVEFNLQVLEPEDLARIDFRKGEMAR